jgi:hypothetical protein
MGAGGLSVKRQKARIKRSAGMEKVGAFSVRRASLFLFLSFEVQPDISAHPVT